MPGERAVINQEDKTWQPHQPLRGVSTVSFFAADHAAERKWYTEFLGVEPYFERPGYVEFRLGDYQHELGIIDIKYVPGVQSNNGRHV